MPEAPLDDTGFGLAPAGDGWFVLNACEAVWLRLDRRGTRRDFESEAHSFPQLDIGLHVLEPGQPAGLYHAESEQEAFLVLSGECRDRAYARFELGRWKPPPGWNSLPWASPE